MPLTKKGRKIMSSVTEQYGAKKGKSVFYASRQKGKISGVDQSRDSQVGAESWVGKHRTGYEINTGDRQTIDSFLRDYGVVPKGMTIVTAKKPQPRASLVNPRTPKTQPTSNIVTNRGSAANIAKIKSKQHDPNFKQPGWNKKTGDAVRPGEALPKVLQFGTAWTGTKKGGASKSWEAPYDSRDARSVVRRFADGAPRAPGLVKHVEASELPDQSGYDNIKKPSTTMSNDRRTLKRFLDAAMSAPVPEQFKTQRPVGDARAIVRAVADAGVDAILDLGETSGKGIPMTGPQRGAGPVEGEAGQGPNEPSEDKRHFFKGSARDRIRRFLRDVTPMTPPPMEPSMGSMSMSSGSAP